MMIFPIIGSSVTIALGSAIGVAIAYGIAILIDIKLRKKEFALQELRMERYAMIHRPEYCDCETYRGTKSTLRQIINNLEDEEKRNYLLSTLNSISGNDYTNLTLFYYPKRSKYNGI